MATSDVFKKKKEHEKVTYAIVGSGINFTFSSGIYNPEDAESMAVSRARALQCQLYSRNENGAIFQIYPYKRRVGKTDTELSQKAYPEMMGNEPFVPGIQVQSY